MKSENYYLKFKILQYFAQTYFTLFRRLSFKSIFFVLFLPLITGCFDEADCIRESSSELRIFFRDIENGDPSNIDINKVTLTGTDSVFFSSVTANGLILPLNILENSSTIIIDSEERVDTLEINYNTVTRLISPDCGPETFITGVTITEYTLDSIRAVNTALSPQIPVNYEIYF